MFFKFKTCLNVVNGWANILISCCSFSFWYVYK